MLCMSLLQCFPSPMLLNWQYSGLLVREEGGGGDEGGTVTNILAERSSNSLLLNLYRGESRRGCRGAHLPSPTLR